MSRPDPKNPQSVADLPFDVTRAPRPKGPPLNWAWSRDRQQRTHWRWYWVREPLMGSGKLVMHHLIRRAPPAAASRVGATLAPIAQKVYRKTPFAMKMRANVQAIRGGDADEADALLAEWWENTGRIYAEFASVEKIAEATETAELRQRLADLSARHGSLMLVSVHVGSWESLFGLLNRIMDRPVIGPYQPEPSRFSNRVVEHSRKRRGVYAFPPGQKSAIYLSRFLSNGSAHGFFMIDEVHKGFSRFPLFGRKVRPDSNAARAVKLAMRNDAVLVPIVMPRRAGARFEVKLFDPVPVAQGKTDEARMRATVRALNGVFEPVVRGNLKQWFMLTAVNL